MSIKDITIIEQLLIKNYECWKCGLKNIIINSIWIWFKYNYSKKTRAKSSLLFRSCEKIKKNIEYSKIISSIQWINEWSRSWRD